jgi:F-type H+-transporting ATPase subunit beta
MARLTGHVVQVTGGVVDVEFSEGEIPNVYDALEVPRKDQPPLVLEVEKHLGRNWVRCGSPIPRFTNHGASRAGNAWTCI